MSSFFQTSIASTTQNQNANLSPQAKNDSTVSASNAANKDVFTAFFDVALKKEAPRGTQAQKLKGTAGQLPNSPEKPDRFLEFAQRDFEALKANARAKVNGKTLHLVNAGGGIRIGGGGPGGGGIRIGGSAGRTKTTVSEKSRFEKRLVSECSRVDHLAGSFGSGRGQNGETETSNLYLAAAPPLVSRGAAPLPFMVKDGGLQNANSDVNSTMSNSVHRCYYPPLHSEPDQTGQKSANSTGLTRRVCKRLQNLREMRDLIDSGKKQMTEQGQRKLDRNIKRFNKKAEEEEQWQKEFLGGELPDLPSRKKQEGTKKKWRQNPNSKVNLHPDQVKHFFGLHSAWVVYIKKVLNEETLSKIVKITDSASSNSSSTSSDDPIVSADKTNFLLRSARCMLLSDPSLTRLLAAKVQLIRVNGRETCQAGLREEGFIVKETRNMLSILLLQDGRLRSFPKIGVVLRVANPFVESSSSSSSSSGRGGEDLFYDFVRK